MPEYQCDLCGEIFTTLKAKLNCEQKWITHEYAQVGDTITILHGAGQGEKALVIDTFIYQQSWGHYDWARYWHTQGVVVQFITSYTKRQLTFDDYQPDPRRLRRHKLERVLKP